MTTPPFSAVNWDNLRHENVGAGLPSAFLDGAEQQLRRVHQALHAKVSSGELPFLALHDDRQTVDEIVQFAREVHESGDFDDCVILGIGGSSLGSKALVDALGAPRLRMHFCDNVDPDKLAHIQTALDWNRTLFVAITKSGSTVETIAQTLWVRQRLRALYSVDEARRRLIAVTDPQDGFLRELATQEGFTSFSVPPNVGGRYSVFTPVGLLPAALAGIDIKRIMKGMSWAVSTLRSADPTENSALAVAGALAHLSTHDGRAVLATVPYRNCLESCARWFAQLWAESLGKDGHGSTPVTAVGSTVQHSQLQLWMDGPPNTVVQFIDVQEFDHDITVDTAEFPQWSLVNGLSLGQILRSQLQATTQALRDAKRPNLTWTLPAVTPESVAAWMVCMEAITAYAGGVLNVNPFDQPGVEATKTIARQLLTQGARSTEN